MSVRSPAPARAPAIYPLFGIVAGLLLADNFPVAPVPPLLGAIPTAALALFYSRHRNRPRLWTVFLLAATTLAFWAYGSLRLPAPPTSRALELPPREASVTFKWTNVYQAETPFGTANGIGRVLEAPETSRLEAGDRIYASITPPADYPLPVHRGLRIKATGILHPIPPASPENTAKGSANDFARFLKSIGIHYRFERGGDPRLAGPPPAFHRLCAKWNEKFQRHLRLGEPPGSGLGNVYLAMLLGRKTELSSGQRENFRLSGTMHLFAVSGLHIGVISAVLAQTLLLLRVPRPLTPLLGLPAVYLYVEIIGAPPSAMRAFLMAAFFWMAYSIQRQRAPLAALVGSAIFVLLIAPSQLWMIGFQLSYLVVVTILLFGLPLYQALAGALRPYPDLPSADWGRRHRSIDWTLDKLFLFFAISFAAWLASTPLSAGLFGFVAPGAILLNMLLVNLASLVISGGILAIGAATLALPPLAAFLNHSAWVLITVMEAFVDALVRTPGAVLHTTRFPESLSYSTVLAFVGYLLWMRTHHKAPGAMHLLAAPMIILLPTLLGILLTS